MKHAVVVGGGAIGVASAYALSERGWQVTLVDRGALGAGCSFANAGLITTSHSDPIPGPGVVGQALRWMLRSDSPFYVRPRLDLGLLGWGWQFRRFCTAGAAERGFAALAALSRFSFARFERLAGGGLEFDYERRGLLMVYVTDAGLAGARHEVEVLSRFGFPARLLSRDEVLAMEPAIAPDIKGGLFTDHDAHGSCHDYVLALARRLVSRGATLREQLAVTGIDVDSGRVLGVRVRDTDGERRLGADLVILAAGSWSPAIAATLGIAIPLQPAKGYSCTFDRDAGAPRIPFMIKEHRVAVTPIGGRLRFGGTLELAGFDDRVDDRRYAALVRAGRSGLAHAVTLTNEARWSGLRPVTPDGLPIVDRVPRVEGLIIATGHAMLGFTQAPGTGDIVAALAEGEPPPISIEPFRLDRFGR